VADLEKCLALADWIEANDHPDFVFDMTVGLATRQRDCKTVGCIAGAAVYMTGDVPTTGERRRNPLHRAQEILDLNDAQAEELFRPYIFWPSVTPRIAARALRAFVEAGGNIRQLEWISLGAIATPTGFTRYGERVQAR
jgi:hypothetical protein